MYLIKKVDTKITDMHDSVWAKAELAVVDTINWPEKYDFNPGMQARLLYSDYGIHVRLTTQEQPLLARVTEQNGDIYKDSCMEFFFRPNSDDPRYLNFEINPFGTMYLAIRTGRDDPAYPTEDKSYFGVVSEVTDKEWTLMFTVPFEFIDRNFGKHTNPFYGNIYKCGDETVRPHLLSYYPIKREIADFHRPEFFDEFMLEQ